MTATLRYARILTFIAISATVMALHLAEFTATSLAAWSLLNALHAPGFGLVAVGVMLLFRHHNAPGVAYFWASVITLLLGLAAEALQNLGPRNASLQDVGWNVLGITGCLAVAACLDPGLRNRISRRLFALLLTTGALALTFALKPVVKNAWVLGARALSLPVLVSFDHSWETAIYRPLDATQLSTLVPPDNWPVQTGRIMAMDFSARRYSGISIDAYPDWTDYDSISFLAASADGQEHRLSVRIHDAAHNQLPEDRFNTIIRVGPTVTRHKIEVARIRDSIEHRHFDLSEVAGIIIFKTDAAGRGGILIDDFRLEND